MIGNYIKMHFDIKETFYVYYMTLYYSEVENIVNVLFGTVYFILHYSCQMRGGTVFVVGLSVVS